MLKWKQAYDATAPAPKKVEVVEAKKKASTKKKTTKTTKAAPKTEDVAVPVVVDTFNPNAVDGIAEINF